MHRDVGRSERRDPDSESHAPQSGGAPTNRLTSVTTSGVAANYLYDSAGNVTNDGSRTYTYDAENRIVSVDSGATASYAYDTSNQRYKKGTGGATTHYVWQGSQVIAEHNGSTGAVVTDYVYSGSRMIANVSGGSTQYFLSDRLSMRVTLNSSASVLGRQAHPPFGEDFAESATQEKHHFTGYERDGESGSDYAVNRQYAQGVGRFARPDPLSGSVSNPQSLNRFSYVLNDPVNAVDPQGLDPGEGGIQICETDPETEEVRCDFYLVPLGPSTGSRKPKPSAAQCKNLIKQLQAKMAAVAKSVDSVIVEGIVVLQP